MRRGSSGARMALAALTVLLIAAPGASAKARSSSGLAWQDCGDGFRCTSLAVPRDHGSPRGAKIQMAVVRLPAQDTANRLGALVVNYGGPGGDGVATTKAVGRGLFGALNERYDIVSFDPRGTGETLPSISCDANLEEIGPYSKPYFTPENLDVAAMLERNRTYIDRCLSLSSGTGILPYLSTSNVARDMDLLRAALGEPKLTYLGFSYGTFLGTTYAKLFPKRTGRLVLDGAVDPDRYINKPVLGVREQTAAFEKAIDRYFQGCAAAGEYCAYGQGDPADHFDELVERLNANPVPREDGRPISGDDALSVAFIVAYSKLNWPIFTDALNLAAEGDYSLLGLLADFANGRNEDGTYDPSIDRFFMINALEARMPSGLDFYLESGDHAWNLFTRAWSNTGYADLLWAMWPVQPRGAYYGPWRLPDSVPTPLVVGTTYDPATPYRAARRLTSKLGNARLLTMRGDGHTAYGGNSACIDAAVEAYLVDGVLPGVGKRCRQEVPFPPPPEAAASRRNLARSLLDVRFSGHGHIPLPR
jgi:pimeloyl-ACP methyl ester carboxylesterase